MSLINTTVWATVSMSTIKSTPVWQEHQDATGKVPRSEYKETLRAALYFLGHDEDSGGYTKEANVNIRSNMSRQAVIVNTTLFTFPVRTNYPYKRVYQKADVLHFGDEGFAGWGISHIKMEDFGNEHDPSREDDSDQ